MKKIFLFTAFLLLIIGTVSAQTPTTIWSDNAETSWYNAQDSEFTLSTPAELAGLSVLVANGNDFAGKTIFIDSDLNLEDHLWTPIGVNHTHPFSGFFNGNNHVISNMFVIMPTESNIGLFGACIEATLLNIRIENPYLRGKDSVGPLTGNNWMNVVIENCHATGVDIVSTGFNVGGLVGDLVEGASMHRCSSEGNVRGDAQVGGLLGSPYDGCTITESFSLGSVHATYIAGGLIGVSLPGMIATDDNIVENCYSRANVVSDMGFSGGFCGNSAAFLIINNSYSTGTAVGTEYVGGFIGGGGGIIAENCFWDSESSAHSESMGGAGAPPTAEITSKTTAEMKAVNMVDILNDGTGPWAIDPNVNDGYPSFTSATSSLDAEVKTNVMVKVYPNVFTDKLQINSDAQLESYSIFEISGKEVQSGTLKENHAKITVKPIQTGIYVIVVKTNQGEFSKKIVKSTKVN